MHSLALRDHDVRSILAGRKSQHRIPVNPKKISVLGSVIDDAPPYQLGQEIWVRECHAILMAVSPATDEPLEITDGEKLIEAPTSWVDFNGRTRWHYDGTVIAYRANSEIEFCDGDGFSTSANKDDLPKWRPSTQMKREHSRINLRVKNIYTQRLQSITEKEAAAEGFTTETLRGSTYKIVNTDGTITQGEMSWTSCYYAFATLYNKFAKPGFQWADNPWMWVVDFERI